MSAQAIGDLVQNVLARCVAASGEGVYVRALFDYDGDTGHLSWAASTAPTVKIGDRAGSLKSNGYREVRFNGKSRKEHRVIWLWCNGAWPDGEIDHINGDRSDNRISNLRVVTRVENMRNSHKARGAGRIGVSWHKANKRWQANIGVAGKTIYLGSFATEEEARSAYLVAKATHHQLETA